MTGTMIGVYDSTNYKPNLSKQVQASSIHAEDNWNTESHPFSTGEDADPEQWGGYCSVCNHYCLCNRPLQWQQSSRLQVSIQYSAEPFYCYDVCVLIYNVTFNIEVTAAWNRGCTASAGLLVTNRKEERWKRGRK